MARIVAIDNERDICQLIERVLSGCGHEVITFTDAERAVEWLNSHRPDLVLLDLMLNGCDGLSVLGQIRIGSPGVKTVMMTGSPSQEARKRAADLGISDFLVKPLDICVLEECVMRALG